MRQQLTDLSVRQLKAAEKQYKVWDAKTPGFGIIVGCTTKSWFAVYGRARKFKALGRYPDLSLADARTAAKKLLLERSDRAASKAFGEALNLYKATHLSTLRKSSAYALTTLMERHYRSWASKDLDDITGAEIVRYLDTLLDTPTERYKAFKELRAFFRWCMGRQYMHANPCADLRAPETPKSRDRVLSDDELIAVWRAGEAGYNLAGDPSLIGRLVSFYFKTPERYSYAMFAIWRKLHGVVGAGQNLPTTNAVARRRKP